MITSTISHRMRHLVKIAAGVTSPHIAKVTTHFFFISWYAKSLNRPRAQAVEPILICDTSTDAFWGLEHIIFTSSPSKPPKTPFLGTYNGKPMGNRITAWCIEIRRWNWASYCYLLDCLTITVLDRTYHAHHFIILIFCLFRVEQTKLATRQLFTAR